MESLETLKKAVITLKDMAKARNITRQSAAVEISRAVKKGRLARVEKGKYALTSDMFAIASGLVQPSYISFGSALYLRGLLEQTVTKIYVVSPKYKKGITFGNIEIKFIKFGSGNIFGYEKIKRGEFFAFIAETEKAIADCLYAPRYFELSYLDEALGRINSKKLEEYALKMGSVAAIKRAGYLLELAGHETALARKRLSGVHALVPGKKGRWNKKWRIYV